MTSYVYHLTAQVIFKLEFKASAQTEKYEIFLSFPDSFEFSNPGALTGNQSKIEKFPPTQPPKGKPFGIYRLTLYHNH